MKHRKSLVAMLLLSLSVTGCGNTDLTEALNQVSRATAAAEGTGGGQAITNIKLSSAENDYLYDLEKGIERKEYDRTSLSEKLRIGQALATWAQKAQNIEAMRQLFDYHFGSAVTGDYGLNREGYIVFAVRRLAPGNMQALQPKQPDPEVIVKREYVSPPVTINNTAVATAESTLIGGYNAPTQTQPPHSTEYVPGAFNATVRPDTNCRVKPDINADVRIKFRAGDVSLKPTSYNGWYFENYNHCWIRQDLITWR